MAGSGGLLKGQGPGSTPNDMGAQNGAGADFGGSDSSLESLMVTQSEKFTPGHEKDRGFVNVAGTSPTGNAK